MATFNDDHGNEYKRDSSPKYLNWERKPPTHPTCGKGVDAPKIGKIVDVTNRDMTCKGNY